MAISSFKMGPGTLKFDVGGSMDVSCQITKGTITPVVNVDTTEAIAVLCGEEIPEEEEVDYRWTLDATVVQDITAVGFVAWTWTNKGLTKTFEFIPNTAAARKITGSVRIDPVTLGGDVKTRNTSDLSFPLTPGTDPVLADV